MEQNLLGYQRFPHMAPMKFDAYARRQAQVLFDALADNLVKDLSTVAADEAVAAAVQARQEAEQATEIALAAAHAEGEARLAAAQAMNAGLLDSVEAAREEVRTTQAESAEELRIAQAAAEKQLRTAQAEAQKELRTVQAEAEEHLRTVQTEAQEEVRAARTEAQEEQRTSQAAAKERVRTTQAAAQAEIERVRGELEARLDEREQALDAARRDARLATEAVEGARQGVTFARMEADSCRQDRALVIDRVGAALSAIDRATTASDILETLLEPLGHEFARAAVFLVGPSSLNGWRARGLDATTDITTLVISRADDSPLARAVTGRAPFYVTATPAKPLPGLLGTSDFVTRAVALPVLAGDQVIAVAYAEDVDATGTLQEPATAFPGVACRIAEMLIDHAMLRLTTKRTAPARPVAPHEAQQAAYSPARQARRLKVQKGIDVTLDGSESSLVDLSSIGAQLLSPLAMPPNRMVKMTLRTKDAALACKGRVMWARFEQPSRTAAARYRVGVKFTDIEAKALEGLMKQHGIAESA